MAGKGNAFNPTMVRLLLVVAGRVCRGWLLSIPQWCDCCTVTPVQYSHETDFQSHNGAIAAGKDRDELKTIITFNPTMVRLLPAVVTPTLKALGTFNPTMVRLLHHRYPALPDRSGNFQSHNGAIAAASNGGKRLTSVRLSIPQWCDCCLSTPLNPHLCRPTFNPTMVRLLPGMLWWAAFIFTVFQSHNGAIAAVIGDEVNDGRSAFNPTMVRLLRFTMSFVISFMLRFQSHNGAIAAL